MCKLDKYTDFRIEDTVIMEYFGNGGSVIIPEGVTDIFFQVFTGFDRITSVKIPSTVSDITPFLFEGCSSLNSVEPCEGVDKIGSFSFSGCASLESVFLPKSISCVENGAFYGCGSFVIHYAGSEQMWKKVKVNAALDNITIIFDSTRE